MQSPTTAPNGRDYADPIVFALAYNAYRDRTAKAAASPYLRISDPTALANPAMRPTAVTHRPARDTAPEGRTNPLARHADRYYGPLTERQD